MKYYLVTILAIISLHLKGQSLEINSKNGTDIEIRGKEQLERLIEVYGNKIKNWNLQKKLPLIKVPYLLAIPFSRSTADNLTKT